MKVSTMLITFLFLTSLSTKAQELEYSFNESYEISIPTKLNISSSNSDINVLTHDKNTIEVYYVVKKNGELLKVNKERLTQITNKQYRLDIQNSANELTLEVINIPKKGFTKSEDTIIIDFIVYVPKQTNCDLLSSDGNILLQGLNSNQKCITNDGDIELTNLKGNVIAKTSDGDIIIDNVIGKVHSQTKDGQIIKTKK